MIRSLIFTAFFLLAFPVTARSADLVLPAPVKAGTMSVEEALAGRRSVRDYSTQSLTLTEVGQLAWAAQGITSPEGYRTAPSAGGLYPLELYVATKNVEGLEPGLYHYIPATHSLKTVMTGDLSAGLQDAALGQEWVGTAPAVLVLTGIESRTAKKYKGRAERYVKIEIGNAAQNIYLQATALNLGTVSVGGLHDKKLKTLLSLGSRQTPFLLMPVGHLQK